MAPCGSSMEWRSDSRRLTYEFVERGFGSLRVIEIDAVARRQRVLVELSGCWPDQDPYFIHHAMVGIDDAKVVPLTRSDGNHEAIDFSPDGNYYVCRWSRVDQPPVHELRRTSDGELVHVLARADASALLATGGRPPQPFAAKDRDGEFDVWGVIIRPPDFDPAKKYPVIEDIYAGPHDSFVPKSWDLWQRNLRELACRNSNSWSSRTWGTGAVRAATAEHCGRASSNGTSAGRGSPLRPHCPPRRREPIVAETSWFRRVEAGLRPAGESMRSNQ